MRRAIVCDVDHNSLEGHLRSIHVVFIPLLTITLSAVRGRDVSHRQSARLGRGRCTRRKRDAIKPVAINQFIGRRPIAAFGNSDGDRQMLEWTAAGRGNRLVLLVHHTDAAREYAYDRDSSVGKLEEALYEANAKGWVVVDMKKDWKRIFAFDKSQRSTSSCPLSA